MAQQSAPPQLPVDESTQKITYTNKAEQAGTKDELYDRGMAWVNKFYKNPQAVTKVRDKENGQIKCVHRFKTVEAGEDGLQLPKHTVQYDLIIDFKDGKYRYQVSEFILVGQSRIPVEKWLDPQEPSYAVGNFVHLTQIDAEAKKITASLEAGMQPAVVKKDDW